MNVAQAMSKAVVTVPMDMPVKQVAALLTKKGIGGAPIVVPDGKVIGVISESDLLVRPEAETLQRQGWWRAAFTSRETEAKEFVKTHGQTAGDVMTGDVVAVAPNASLADAARLMTKKGVHRLLILDAGRPVGILARSDVLRVLASQPLPVEVGRADGAILDDIEARMREAKWTPGRMVSVVVDCGVVHFHGYTESGAQRDALRVLAKAVPGVKGVDDDLSPLNLTYAYGGL